MKTFKSVKFKVKCDKHLKELHYISGILSTSPFWKSLFDHELDFFPAYMFCHMSCDKMRRVSFTHFFQNYFYKLEYLCRINLKDFAENFISPYTISTL